MRLADRVRRGRLGARTGVDLLERLDERLNADNLAENVADLGLQTARQLAAQVGARAADTDVGRDLDENAERLLHKLDAQLALGVACATPARVAA